MPQLKEILAIILGGGRGTRLYPLTKLRSKPAVPIAGKYRLIDIPISNCINSDIYRIAVLTQFNSVSLHRHITSTYHFDDFHAGWVQIWAAEQTMETKDWYQGTADAVRKQLFQIKSARCAYTLILAGDHLYRMDYTALAKFHWENQAEITIAVQPVLERDADRFGILKRDDQMRITRFAEKPTDPQVLKEMVSRSDPYRPYLGSMGIYLFNTDVLIEMLNSTHLEDFGKHIIPAAIETRRVFGYDFDDYWEDIGTIRSFYETNLELTRADARFNFYDPLRPIYTRPRYLPGSIVSDSDLRNVMLAEGCGITKSEIVNSILGVRSQIMGDVFIRDSVLMGSDYYEGSEGIEVSSDVPIGIGRGSIIEGAIIDKNARIGAKTIIRPFPRGTEAEHDNWSVQDGIIIIHKNAIIPPGTIIAP